MIQANKLQVRQKSKDRVKKHMISNGFYDPDKFIEDFSNNMDKSKGELSSKLCEDYQRVAMTLGLDTHLPIAESLPEDYRLFLVEIIKNVEKEYGCKSSIEKALAETIALSHVRVIHLTKTFNNYTLVGTAISKEKNNYYNLIGKELDRAHRQLSNGILTLKQIKSPTIPFNVTAKTAFFAKNQQINDNKR